MTIAELRAARAKKIGEFEKLVEKMNADAYAETAEDKTAYDTLKKDIDGFDTKIARQEEANKLKAATAREVVTADRAPAASAIPAQAKRYSRLKAFKGDEAEKNAYEAGMFIRATMFKDGGARAWCVEHGLEPMLKAQSEGTNSAGGYLVPVQFETAIIDLRESYGTFRRECKLVPMGSDNVTYPRRVSGVTAYWVAENAQITASQKGWGQVSLSAKKLAALTLLSTELAEDAVINVADDLAQEMAYAFAVAEDAAGWNGDGTSTYGGITGVKTKFVAGLSSYIGAPDAASGHDTFAEIDANDIVKVMQVLPLYAQKTAKFYMSQQCWAGVFQRLMAAAGGNSVDTLTGVVSPRYLGYPVVLDQTLPTTTGDLSDVPMFYFGDLSLAVIMGERRGVRVKTSDDRYFEYDQIGVQATERVDINVHDIGDATTAGPLVALMGE